MQTTINTVISFVAAGNVDPGTTGGGSVQTGDMLNIVAIILAVIFASLAMVVYLKASFSRNSIVASQTTRTTSIKGKLLASPFAIIAAAFLFCGLVSNSVNALANPNGSVVGSDKVIATVDEQTGSVNFQDGFVKSQDGVATFKGVKLDLNKDIEVPENCTWQVFIDDYKIYDDVAGKEAEGNIAIWDNALKFGVKDLGPEAAKSLIGKDVLSISFTFETMSQEEAEEIAEEEVEYFYEVINDTQTFPETELLAEDKAALEAQIATKKAEVDALIAGTSDPKELSKILLSFDEYVANLIEQAKATQAQTIKEKNDFTETWNSNIDTKSNEINDDAWLKDSEKEKYTTKLNTTKSTTLPKVLASTSRDSLDKAKEDTSQEVAATSAEYEAASGQAETQQKSAAKVDLEASEKAFKDEVQDKTKYPEKYLFETDREAFEEDLSTTADNAKADIDDANSPAGIDAAKASFIASSSEIIAKVAKKTKETQDAKAADIEKKKASIDAKTGAINNDTWVSDEVKLSYTTKLGEIKSHVDDIDATTSQADWDSLDKSIETNISSISAEFSKVQKDQKTAIVKERQAVMKKQIATQRKLADSLYKKGGLWEEDYNSDVSAFQEVETDVDKDLNKIIEEESATTDDLNNLQKSMQAELSQIEAEVNKQEANKSAEISQTKAALENKNKELKELEASKFPLIYTDNLESFNVEIKEIDTLKAELDKTLNHASYSNKLNNINSKYAALFDSINASYDSDVAEKEAIIAEINKTLSNFCTQVDKLSNMSASKKEASKAELNALVTDSQKQDIMKNSQNSADAMAKQKVITDSLQNKYSEIYNTVRPWQFSWNPPAQIQVIQGGSYTFTSKPDLSADERAAYAPAPTFTLGGGLQNDFTMTLNADGYPVISANSTTTISTHNGSLQILYSAVTDYGSNSSRDYKISINVIAPDVPWWGVKDSADGNGKTLYLAGEEVQGKADTPDESILNGFASWSDAPWYSYENDIVKVEILETSKKIKLNSSERLFGSLNNVTSLTGLKNLDMTNVKKASLMFAHFGRYGSGCTADIQNLTTSAALNATNQMFYYAHFTSFNPTGMNTEEVTTFDEMFGGFSINDGIMDLSSFSNNKANNIGSMFWQVTNVTTIYADSSKWQSDHYISSKFNTFHLCTNLVGHGSDGSETPFDASHKDGDYARVSTLDTPGYFTEKPSAFWGVVDSEEGNGKTLYLSSTFVKDKAETEAVSILSGFSKKADIPWNNDFDNITKVEVLKPLSCITLNNAEYLFAYLEYAQSVVGLENIDMTNVKKATCMFHALGRFYANGYCQCDFTNLMNTGNLESVSQMFSFAKAAKLELTSMDTTRTSDFSSMFNRVTVEDQIIDISSFSNKAARDIRTVFHTTNVKSIYADPLKWSSDHYYAFSGSTFTDSTNLKGIGSDGSSLEYDANKDSGSYAKVCRLGEGNEGYFSDKTAVLLNTTSPAARDADEEELVETDQELTANDLLTETLVQESVTDDENIEELVEAVEAVEETSVTNTLYSFMTSVFEISLFFMILAI